MKRLKTYFVPALVFSALVLFFSCNADKLELTNPNNLSPDTFFKTAAQVQSAVDAVYGSMQTTGMYNRGMWYGNDNSSHENTCNPQQEADKRQWLNFTHDATHSLTEAFWNSCYRGINKANFVINNSDKINEISEAFLPKVMKDKYIGEALFMRALYYFWLVEKFGDVPIYLGVDPAENLGMPRAPKAQVWAQIEADCIEAVAKCRTKAEEVPGRATKGSAWALLGKARLYQKNYAGALEAFNNVTGYSLEAAYFDNFKEETENGVESIFEVQFSKAAGYSSQWSSDRTDQGVNEGTFRAQEYSCLGWFNVFISEDLWNEFEAGDPRRGYCAYQTGDSYAGGTITLTPLVEVIDGDTARYTRRGWRKYQNYYKQASETDNTSGINMKVIRYADVLLMKAECQANLGNLGDAIDLMNEVRNRPDVAMPEYGTTAMDDAGFPVGDLTQFMTALEHERKIELCGEQVRLPDLVRWGKLASFLSSDKLLNSIPRADKAALVFRSPKNLLWPIPQKELDVNPNMGPEDQNEGY
jgi:hypothetical protein